MQATAATHVDFCRRGQVVLLRVPRALGTQRAGPERHAKDKNTKIVI